MTTIVLDWRILLVLVGILAAWRLCRWARRKWIEAHSLLHGLEDVLETNEGTCALCGRALTVANTSGWYYFKECNGRTYRQNSCVACNVKIEQGGKVQLFEGPENSEQACMTNRAVQAGRGGEIDAGRG